MVQTATAPLLVSAGLSESFAHFVIKGERSCSVPVALWLLDTHGLIVPQLQGKTDAELAALRGMFEPAPPSTKRKRAQIEAAA